MSLRRIARGVAAITLAGLAWAGPGGASAAYASVRSAGVSPVAGSAGVSSVAGSAGVSPVAGSASVSSVAGSMGVGSAGVTSGGRGLAAACGPSFSDQLAAVPWPLLRLRPEAAWPVSRGRGVVVAVLDSGVSTSHPKLAGRVLPGADFVSGGAGDCDNDGHGTLVASLIVGRDSADSPFHGIAPDARVLPVKVLPTSQSDRDPAISQRIANAIVWAVGHGATVINLSLFTTNSPALADAVRYALEHDVVVIAAAGNTGDASSPDSTYPASYPGVLAVGGVDRAGAHVSTSTVGSFVRVAAPGVDIQGAAPQGGGYVVDQKGGTSFAAAYVSGVAALVRSEFPRMRAADVIRRIMSTADAPPDGHDARVGFGVVNPYRAVATVLADDDTVVPTPRDRLAPTGGFDAGGARLRNIALGTAAAGLLVALILVVIVPLVRRANSRTNLGV